MKPLVSTKSAVWVCQVCRASCAAKASAGARRASTSVHSAYAGIAFVKRSSPLTCCRVGLVRDCATASSYAMAIFVGRIEGSLVEHHLVHGEGHQPSCYVAALEPRSADRSVRDMTAVLKVSDFRFELDKDVSPTEAWVDTLRYSAECRSIVWFKALKHLLGTRPLVQRGSDFKYTLDSCTHTLPTARLCDSSTPLKSPMVPSSRQRLLASCFLRSATVARGVRRHSYQWRFGAPHSAGLDGDGSSDASRPQVC